MITIICQNPLCNKAFVVKPSWADKTKYCSMACYRTRPEATLLTLVCENPVCQKTFAVVASLDYRRHCSRTCYRAAHRMTLLCENPECQQPFTLAIHEQKRTRKYCSPTCYHLARTRPIEERFWEKVLKDPDGCWLWQGYRTALGYGEFLIRTGISRYASKVAYELTYGPVPEGIFICHHCDNPPCCRPDHLFAGTPKENTHDAMAKGRLPLKFVHGTQGVLNHNAKLTDDDIRYIRALQGHEKAKKVAEIFHTKPSLIYRIWKRQVWKHLD